MHEEMEFIKTTMENMGKGERWTMFVLTATMDTMPF